MDQEDLGAFGIAPQVLRAKDDFAEHNSSRQRSRPIFAAKGSIPGIVLFIYFISIYSNLNNILSIIS